jgi:hypothetical protein
MSDIPPEVHGQRKIEDGVDWRGTVSIDMDDTTVDYTHRMLNESELFRVREAIDTSEVQNTDDDGINEEARDRLIELQQKDNLTDEERDEMRELGQELAGDEDSLSEALGEDGMYLIMEMGQNAIKPSEEYVEWVLSEPPSTQREQLRVDEIPNPLRASDVEELLTSKLRDDIDGQPYPIKIQIGMAAFAETLSVLGNGSPT